MPESTGKSSATDGASVREEAGFDQVVERLRAVVEKLETGSLGLEQSLSAFEEGVRLSRRGSEILDGAERRVELLLRGEDGDKLVPFPAAAAAGTPAEGTGEGTGGDGA
jgi:exodeoxyribonuclease VII small subunit